MVIRGVSTGVVVMRRRVYKRSFVDRQMEPCFVVFCRVLPKADAHVQSGQLASRYEIDTQSVPVHDASLYGGRGSKYTPPQHRTTPLPCPPPPPESLSSSVIVIISQFLRLDDSQTVRRHPMNQIQRMRQRELIGLAAATIRASSRQTLF